MDKIDLDMMENMINDFLADIDNINDDDPLVLDGNPYINDLGKWEQAAHDSKYSYTLVADNDGIIYIMP